MKSNLWLIGLLVYPLMASRINQAVDETAFIKFMIPQMINSHNITVARQRLESELRWNKFYQIATVSTGAAVLGFSFYKLFLSPSTPASLPLTQADANPGTLMQSDINNLRTVIEIYKANNSTQSLFSSWPTLHWLKQQFYTNAQTLIIGVGATLVFNGMNNALGPLSKYINRLDGILDRTASALFHKNNLEWYIANHVNLVVVFNMLEYNAALLEGRSVQIPVNVLLDTPVVVAGSTETKDAFKDVIAFWNMYVRQVELILGFIEYKYTNHGNALEADRMKEIGKKIMDLTNGFAATLQAIKIDGADKAQQILLYDSLRVLRAKIGQELSNFSVLESFKRHDFVQEIAVK